MNKSRKDLIDCAHQRKNDDLRWLRPDGETQVQTVPKQVLRIQLQPREQIVGVPILSKIHSRLRQPLCRFPAWMYSTSTKNVLQVMEEIGDIVGSITRTRLMAHC